MSSLGRTYIRALLEDGSKQALREIKQEWLTEEEMPLYQFVVRHLRHNNRLPDVETVRENGFTLGRAREPVSYYAERLQSRAVFNMIAQFHPQLVQAMEGRNMDAAVQAVLGMASAVRQEATTNAIRSVGLEVSEIMSQMAVPMSSSSLIPFGYAPLDNATDGMQPGDLNVLAGRPNVGKSFYLLNYLMHGWRAINSPMVITMEMKIRQLATRMIGLDSGIDTRFIRRRELSTWGRSRMAETVRDFQMLPPLTFVSGHSIGSVDDIELLVQDIQPDCLYIDAAYLVQADQHAHRRARWENITIVINRLKMLADKADIPILITVQLNRGQKSKNSVLTDGLESLAGADSIGQDASVVVGITPGAGIHSEDRRRHTVIKNREGPKHFSWETKFQFSPRMDFSHVPEAAEQERIDMMRNMI